MAERRRGPKPKTPPVGTLLAGKPKPPDWLDADARAHWKEVCDLVAAAGLLSRLDRDALSLYCSHWSRWRKAEAAMASPGPDKRPEGEVITARNGYRQPNPWYTIATAAMKDMKPFLDMFGLSPKARAKLQLPESEEDDGGGKWAGIA